MNRLMASGLWTMGLSVVAMQVVVARLTMDNPGDATVAAVVSLLLLVLSFVLFEWGMITSHD